MTRRLVCIMIGMLALAGWSQGSGTKPSLTALKQAAKDLRAQQKDDLKDIGERYKILIARLQDPEMKLEKLRTELRKEEQLSTKGIKNAKEKKEIKAEFDELVDKLAADVKGRKETVRVLKEQKAALEKRVKAAYAPKINELELEILALENAGSSSTGSAKSGSTKSGAAKSGCAKSGAAKTAKNN